MGTCARMRPASALSHLKALCQGFLCLALLLVAMAVDGRAIELGLEQAMTLARERNPELTVYRAGRDRAVGLSQQTLQGMLPTLSVDSNYLRAGLSLAEDIPVPGLIFPPVLEPRDLGPIDGFISGVQLVQPLLNVSAWQARRQAERGVEAARLGLGRAGRELNARVVEAYYGVLTTEQRLDVESSALATAERLHERAVALHEEGLIPPMDIFSARSQVAEMRARLAQAQGDIIAARARLRQVLGIENDVQINLIDPLPLPPRNVPAQAVDPQRLAQRRDLEAGRKNVLAAEAGLRQARAAYLPRVDALARYQWFDGDHPFTRGQDSWVIGIRLSWTPFAGLGQAGAVSVARAEKLEARALLQAQQQQAWTEAQTAHAQWQAALAGWEHAGAAVDAATAALEQTQGRYEVGLSTMTELLRAQTDELAAATRQVNTRFQALVAAYRYRLAAGADD